MGIKKDELKEELDNIEKMNPYARLSYIRSLVKFYKQVESYERSDMITLIDRLILVTKGY